PTTFPLSLPAALPICRFAASHDRVYTPARVDPTAGATAAIAAGIVRAGRLRSGSAARRIGSRARFGRPTGHAANSDAPLLVGGGDRKSTRLNSSHSQK